MKSSSSKAKRKGILQKLKYEMNMAGTFLMSVPLMIGLYLTEHTITGKKRSGFMDSTHNCKERTSDGFTITT